MMRRIFYCCLIVLLAACNSGRAPRQRQDWSVTLEDNKKPYGLWLANRLLPSYFPSAKTGNLNKLFHYTSIERRISYSTDSPALLAMAGLDFFVSREEWLSIIKFARAGNEVLIFASQLDDGIQESLHCRKVGHAEEIPLNQFYDGADNKLVLSLMPDTAKHYGYQGRALGSYFVVLDSTTALASKNAIPRKAHDNKKKYAPSSDDDKVTIYDLDSIPEILGRSKGGPNLIRYALGRGHITLHAAPLVLSNYFLLQPGNRAYLDGVMHTLPDNISTIYLNEYQKRKSSGHRFGASRNNFSVLFKYPPIVAAFWVALATLLLYVLFSIKPLQRRIAIIRPLPNESVSFVETIGRLYYNKGVHANLAEKMIQHFLDWVRSKYNLNTSQLNDAFGESLAAKSAKPIAEVFGLLNMIHEVRLGSPVNADYLHRIYNAIQSFYKG